MGSAGGDDDGTEMHAGVIHTVVRWRLLLWLGVMAGLMTLLALLSLYIKTTRCLHRTRPHWTGSRDGAYRG